MQLQCHLYRTVAPAEVLMFGLQGTQKEQKNELLFSKFGINYAKLPERFRKVRRTRVRMPNSRCMRQE